MSFVRSNYEAFYRLFFEITSATFNLKGKETAVWISIFVHELDVGIDTIVTYRLRPKNKSETRESSLRQPKSDILRTVA